MPPGRRHLVGGVPTPIQRRLRVLNPAGTRRDGRDVRGYTRILVVVSLARSRLLRAADACPRPADLIPRPPAHGPDSFPIWVALAGLETRRPWVRYMYLGVSAPLASGLGLLFLSDQWV
jgi:hypothetical protein